MIVRSIIALLLLLPGLVLGQGDPLVEAYQHYRAGEIEKARTLADRAVTTLAHVENAEAWLLRGFIYKDLYKAKQPAAEAEADRKEAIASLYKSITLDEEGQYRENATQAYDYMCRSYYNDVARALSEMDAEKAQEFFALYEGSVKQLDPSAQLQPREIEFRNALGTVYTKRFNNDRTRVDHFDAAVAAYQRALELDPGNYGANYNLATLYYNRGVYNIQRISAEDDIPGIQRIQEVSREFFQQALPYMLKAHDMNPTRRETLLGLEGIYYSLQDHESSDKFRLLFEELPPQDNDR
jgi:tetratricopeptide (TPR) repeat protein